MYDNYYDIKQFSRPHYDDHPQMSILDRAAQFSPFAALTGHQEMIKETERTTETKKIMDQARFSNYLGFIFYTSRTF